MNTLMVQKRSAEEKAKRLRREGYITGNLYGREIRNSIMLKIDRKEAEKSLKGCMKGTQLMLDVEGTKYDVLIKEIDYNSFKNQILEIDFQALVSNEKVHSVAEIILHNKDKIAEGVVEQTLNEVAYKAYPSAIVDKIIVDVGNMKIGDSLKVGDLDIASNKDIELMTHLDRNVVTVFAPHVSAAAASEENAEETSEEA